MPIFQLERYRAHACSPEQLLVYEVSEDMEVIRTVFGSMALVTSKPRDAIVKRLRSEYPSCVILGPTPETA